jgi:hypothetical protein
LIDTTEQIQNADVTQVGIEWSNSTILELKAAGVPVLHYILWENQRILDKSLPVLQRYCKKRTDFLGLLIY